MSHFQQTLFSTAQYNGMLCCNKVIRLKRKWLWLATKVIRLGTTNRVFKVDELRAGAEQLSYISSY